MAKKDSAKKQVVNAMVEETAWAAAKETLKYFMEDLNVKYAFVKLLLDSGMTTEQIRHFVSVSPQTISAIRNRRIDVVNDALVETLRSMEINKLYVIGGKILSKLDDENLLGKMKGGELAYAYKVLLDSRRLLENKSTANIAVQVQALQQKFEDEAQNISKLLSKSPMVKGKEIAADKIVEAEAAELEARNAAY
jgi:hypothetical protein